jgi:predicted permease
MTARRALAALMRRISSRGRAEARLDTEMREHLQLLEEDFATRGLPPDAARAAARRAFGNPAQIAETYRETRRGSLWRNILRDIRHGGRNLRRQPGFAVAVAGTLALGIAATAVIFGFVDALLLRPLPVAHASRLTVFARQRNSGETVTTFLPREIDQLQAAGAAWTSLIAVAPATCGLTTADRTDRVGVSFVSENYWEALGLQPSAGTLFRSDPANPASAQPVAVLSRSYWEDDFGSDRGVIGRTMALCGVPLTVIGIGPRGFHGDAVFVDTKVFVPRHAPGFRPGPAARPARLLGILGPDVSLAQANLSLARVSDQMALARRDDPSTVRLQAFWERRSRPNPHAARPEMLGAGVFGVLTAIVLVLSCLNAGNLIAVRSLGRSGELAVRTALGATRPRLALHLLVETSMLVAVAGALGVLLAQAMMHGVGSLLPGILAPFAGQLRFSFDWPLALFAFATLAGTGLCVAVLPALQSVRQPVDLLRASSHAIVGRPLRIRTALMALQVAGSLLLCVVAGLFGRSVISMRAQPFGFDHRGVLDFAFNPAEIGDGGVHAVARLESLRAGVAVLPGVQSAALTQSIPLTSTGSWSGRVFADTPMTDRPNVDVGYTTVSTDYFATLRIPLAGRDFSAGDDARAPRVAIVNQAMARACWPDGQAMGRTFRLNDASAAPIQVIGIAGDVLNYSAIQSRAMPFFYLPLAQHPSPALTLQVRSDQPAAAMFRAINDVIRTSAPVLVPFDVMPMTEAIDRAPDGLFLPRLGSWMAGVFSLIGLLLAVVGVYGVVACGVRYRRRELALRTALGASRRQILAAALRRGLLVVCAGVGVGTLLAAGFVVMTANLYWGVSAIDPVTFAAAIVVVSAAALAACYVPARRATRVDPVSILKES